MAASQCHPSVLTHDTRGPTAGVCRGEAGAARGWVVWSPGRGCTGRTPPGRSPNPSTKHPWGRADAGRSAAPGHPRGGCTGTHASPGTVTGAHAHASHPHVLTRTGRTEPYRPVLPHPPAAGPIRSSAARAASVGGVTRSPRPSSAR